VVPPLKLGQRCGRHGTWISDLLPNIQTIADDICIIKSLHTEAINHDPAITYMNTGNQLPGYASMGAWVDSGTKCGGGVRQSPPDRRKRPGYASAKNITQRLGGSTNESKGYRQP